VANHNRRLQGIDCTGQDILIGPGSKELMFLLQLVYYGDLVIPTPSWVSYAPQAQIIGRKINWIQTSVKNDWRLVPEDLDRLCHEDPSRPRIVILNYPANPTGDTYTSDELKQLAHIAREYRVILLSDEIYGELHHRGQHVSLARYYPEGTIISSGLSKWCGAGGWRLGTFTFPPNLRWLLDAMAVVASETYTSTSAPIQYAAIRAFSGGAEIEQYLRSSRRILRNLGRHIYTQLKEAGASLAHPVGAFYLFPDFSPMKDRLAARGIHDSNTLCTRLLEETGVATLPGSEFGRPASELTLRLAYVDFDGARTLAAHDEFFQDRDITPAFLEQYCPNVVNAIDAMCRWLNQSE
jgi:aspartate aminotransferase